MNRLMIVARLKPDMRDEAEALVRKGPPFDPEQLGFERHGVFLTPKEVVFFFEAPRVERIVTDILDEPVFAAALAPWQALVDEPPRIAHELFFWSYAGGATTAGFGA